MIVIIIESMNYLGRKWFVGLSDNVNEKKEKKTLIRLVKVGR